MLQPAQSLVSRFAAPAGKAHCFLIRAGSLELAIACTRIDMTQTRTLPVTNRSALE
jgi:hypothetical protein